ISDDNHHVTEAIGDLYGGDSDADSPKRSSRPLSFLPDSLSDSIHTPFDPFPDMAPPAKSPLRPQTHLDSSPRLSTSPNGPGAASPPSAAHRNGQLSPPLSRSSSDTATQQFPLNDLDYESSPAGLAQELSNLQAIRRMSMDVHNADPDLPSFQSYASGPVSPPALSDDDSQQLFWVPARLHPELAPKEFKTFIEEKVHTIRRRSGDLTSSLSPEGPLGRQDSSGGLRRKKSMLSRQIDTGSGYKDGADRLERKRSVNQHDRGLSNNLQQLEHIVEDPAAIVRRMSMSRSPTPESIDGDVPIIPGAVGAGMGSLKRSTRTTYRRGSLRSQGRVPLSRRLVSRNAETDTEESPATSPTRTDVPELPKIPQLNRVQSEPINGAFEPSNFSRPNRKKSSVDEEQRPGSAEPQARPGSAGPEQEERQGPKPRAFHSRIASNGRTSAHLPGYNAPAPTLQSPVPQIIETPPPQEPERKQQYQLPECTTSRQPPPQQQPQQPQRQQPQPAQQSMPQHPQQQPNGPRAQAQPHAQSQQQRQSPANRQNKHAQAAQTSPIKPQQSLDDLTQHPSPIPGNHSTRVDNLSIIPNLPDEKKDKKSKDKKEDAPRKTSWGWLVGNDKKEKEKEEREKEAARKVKNKLSKPQEKADDTRLDLLQSSMQSGNRGRESVVLDRESVKLDEERKKESNRKASGDKKEKEPGLLSSIFGGGKKKSEKESTHKKNASRGLSPEPPPRILKPDIDYNWTRFSILEERAIYRMAHIKLANPRRELYSQVLLSNFMYSYLAKVQQMHPQIQIGNSKQAKLAVAQQKKEQQQQQQQQQAQQQQQQQPEEFSQYQRYQQQQQQQEQSDKSSEWPSAYSQQENAQQQHHNGYQQQQQKYGQSPRDSHHSQHSVNGGGYSVSNSSNYLGQPVKQGQSDSDKSGDDDMW
ncbi:Protein zds1, partial [Stagonosporopsis vannaccii]